MSPKRDELIAGFETWLVSKGKAPKSRAKYKAIVREFLSWAGEADCDALVLGSRELEFGYFPWFEQSFLQRNHRSPSAHTVRSRRDALSRFYVFLARSDLRPRDLPNPLWKLEVPRPEEKPVDWLSPIEDEALVSACVNLWEQAVVLPLRYLGLRRDELRQLTLDRVLLAPEAEIVRITRAKHKRSRDIPVAPNLLPFLRRWVDHIQQFGSQGDGPFLRTPRGTSAGINYPYDVTKRVATRAGIRIDPTTGASTVTPHTLRRTFGSWLLNGSTEFEPVRMEVVSRLLGHRSVLVTERAYAQLMDSTVRRELFRLRVA